MKPKEELNTLKEEVESVSRKLAELTEEELAQVSGGNAPSIITFSFKESEIAYRVNEIEDKSHVTILEGSYVPDVLNAGNTINDEIGWP